MNESMYASLPVAVVIGLLLVVCIVLVLLMVDFRSQCARQYRTSLRCPLTGGTAMVDVTERFQLGIARRSVRRCSLGKGDGCDESCLERLGRARA